MTHLVCFWTTALDVRRLDREHVKPAMEALEAAVVIWSCWSQQAGKSLGLTQRVGPESQPSYKQADEDGVYY